MSKINAEWIAKKAEECYSLLDDGFQWTDLFAMLPKVIEVAKTAGDLEEAEQKEVACQLICHIIDETDTPWVPDSIVDPILKQACPYLIDLAYDRFSKEEEEK